MEEEDYSRILGDTVPRKKRSDRNMVATQWPRVVEKLKSPNPPEWLVDVMKKANGHDPNLIIVEKEMSSTDLTKNQARLSLPKNQVVSMDFLTEEERNTLKGKQLDSSRKQSVSVVFVDPNSKSHEVELKEWNSLVLSTGWNVVLQANKFKPGEKYPLWSFRLENGTLCFALRPKVENDSLPGNVDPLPNVDDVASKDSGNVDPLLNVDSFASYFENPKDSGNVDPLLNVDSFASYFENPKDSGNVDPLLNVDYYFEKPKDSGNVDPLPNVDSFDEVDSFASYFENPKDSGNAKREVCGLPEKEEISNKRDTKSSSASTVQVLEGIGQMRYSAKRDSMGCDNAGSFLPPKERRFSVLLGSLLPSHTGDQALKAIRRLHQNSLLTAEAIDKADESTITKTICLVGFDISKAKYMKEVAKTCLDIYNGGIPDSEGELLVVFPDIAPEMAHQVIRITKAFKLGNSVPGIPPGDSV